MLTVDTSRGPYTFGESPKLRFSCPQTGNPNEHGALDQSTVDLGCNCVHFLRERKLGTSSPPSYGQGAKVLQANILGQRSTPDLDSNRGHPILVKGTGCLF